MADIRGWLETLDFGDYADAFEANDIDWELLPDLTAADLRSLGVTSAGDRVRLRAAIEAVSRGDPPAEAMPQDTPAPARDIPGDAERRQITVMFCDLVGSTALAA